MINYNAGLIITQLLLYAQSTGIDFCHVFVGDDPQILSGDEIKKLKNDFIDKLDKLNDLDR